MFHLQQSRHPRFSMVQKFLWRLQRSMCFLLFDREKASFSFNLFSTYLKKYYRKKNHSYLNLVYSICHIVSIYRLGKPTKFLILSISIPTSSSSTISNLSEAMCSSTMNTWFLLKTELGRLVFCERSFLHFILFHMTDLFTFSALPKNL